MSIGGGFTQRELDAMARENEARKAHDLTPSEVALARVLGAWEAWPGILDGAGLAMETLGQALHAHGMVDGGEPSAEGAALLDRARRAGVL